MNESVKHPAQEIQLADKDSALSSYFDVLLHDVTDIDEQAASTPEISKNDDSAVKVASTFQIEEEHIDIKKPTVDAAETGKSTAEQSAATEESTSGYSTNGLVTCDAVEDAQGLEEPDDNFTDENYYVEGAPSWANQPFQALEFTVAKLKLVVPLTHLCGILDWERADLTPMPGHSTQFMGVWPNHGTNSKIVDVAEMVVPERYHSKIQPASERVTKVVLIDESTWGIACDEIIGVITLDPRDVRWRTDRTQRKWLAGTLIEHMSAIIDADEFASTLLNGEERAELAVMQA